MATTSTNCVPIASNLFKLFSRRKVTKPPLRFGGHKRKAFKKDGQIVFEENTHKKKGVNSWYGKRKVFQDRYGLNESPEINQEAMAPFWDFPRKAKPQTLRNN